MAISASQRKANRIRAQGANRRVMKCPRSRQKKANTTVGRRSQRGFDYRGKLAPEVGLEPTTLRLTAGCSAIELLRSVGGGRKKGAPTGCPGNRPNLLFAATSAARNGYSTGMSGQGQAGPPSGPGGFPFPPNLGS